MALILFSVLATSHGATVYGTSTNMWDAVTEFLVNTRMHVF